MLGGDAEPPLNLDDYNNAPAGIGPLADEWADKPHRLIYDLTAALTESRAALTAARAPQAEPDQSAAVVSVIQDRLRCMTCGTASHQPYPECSNHISVLDALDTERTLLAAWQKRAYEAEAALISLREQQAQNGVLIEKLQYRLQTAAMVTEEAQQQVIADWAAEVRCWTTPAIVAINLRTFARTLLKLSDGALRAPSAPPPQADLFTVMKCRNCGYVGLPEPRRKQGAGLRLMCAKCKSYHVEPVDPPVAAPPPQDQSAAEFGKALGEFVAGSAPALGTPQTQEPEK